MASRPDLVLPAILGVMAAGRGQYTLAFVAWQGLDPRAGSMLGKGMTAILSAGEVVLDKTPWVPDRTESGALYGRIGIGALAAAAAARYRHRSILPAALVGATAAAGGSFALNRARRWLGQHTPLPDFAWAVAEDAGVAALGVAAARRL